MPRCKAGAACTANPDAGSALRHRFPGQPLSATRGAGPARGARQRVTGEAGGAAQIDRYDRSRNVTIDIEAQDRPVGDVLEEADRLPSLRHLPASVRRIEAGDVERMTELLGSVATSMAIGVLWVYCVLVLLFHDFLQPATILVALPRSLGGAFTALAVCGFSISLPSLIGMVMLMGIVTKTPSCSSSTRSYRGASSPWAGPRRSSTPATSVPARSS